MNTLRASENLLKSIYLETVNNIVNNHRYDRKRRGYIVPVRTEPKIGRNEPCPCQSGKKYKYCCGR